jgi:drug/metabolite transporter (DMT)-like permease
VPDVTDTAGKPPDRRLDRATRIAWIGCGFLGLLFVGSGVWSVIASVATSDPGRSGPDLIMAFIGVVAGAISIVAAVRVRRRDSAGVRFASVVLRLVLVVAGGSLVFSVVSGVGQHWGHLVWSLVATVCTAALLAALEQLRTLRVRPE